MRTLVESTFADEIYEIAFAINQDLPAGPGCGTSVCRLAVLDSQITAAASKNPMRPKAAKAMRASMRIGIGVRLWIIVERGYPQHGDYGHRWQ